MSTITTFGTIVANDTRLASMGGSLHQKCALERPSCFSACAGFMKFGNVMA